MRDKQTELTKLIGNIFLTIITLVLFLILFIYTQILEKQLELNELMLNRILDCL